MTSNEIKQPISFSNIMGQGRINQLGGIFINGRPLPHYIRVRIIEMANKGIKPCLISRQLRVSHGAVSKILNRYAETGSVSPGQIGGNPRSRMAIHTVEKHIQALKAKRPELCASELRACLIEQSICSVENAPTVSSINRLIRSKKMVCSKSDKKSHLNHSIANILGISNDQAEETSEASSSEEESEAVSSANGIQLSKNRSRRNRISFSSEQLQILESAFQANTYPEPDERERIASSTKLNEEKIMTWFSNRRARCRKNLAISGANPFLSPNILPVVHPSQQMQHSHHQQQAQTVPFFPNQINFFPHSISPPMKMPQPELLAASMAFYPQYPQYAQPS